MTTTVRADFTLASGQELRTVDEDTLHVLGGAWAKVDLNGRVVLTSSNTGVVFAMRAGGDAPGTPRMLTLGGSGRIDVESTVKGGYAGGIAAGGNLRIVNLGSIDVRSNGEALGVGAGQGGFENRGSITVTSPGSGAGVTLDLGGAFNNSGTILVTAGSGQFQGSIGVRVYQTSTANVFTNSGTIRALDNHAAVVSVGVMLAGYTVMVNSGVIEGEQSLRLLRDGIASGNGRGSDITNSGTLRGEVFLNNTAAEPVTLRNSGLIQGAVTLNTGTDTYDGVEGVVTGVVRGEAGADSLIGGSGAETLQGDSGADTLDGGAGGLDVLDGGEGIDMLAFGGAGAGVALDLVTLTASTGVRFSNFEQYLGSGFDDAIRGSTSGDTLGGAGGADTVSGGVGEDRIDGGAGADYLRGEEGADSIDGGAGADYLRGDEGSDSIVGGADFDDINGNMGADTASGGLGEDWVVGGKDNDRLFGDAGQDLVYGNLGEDTCDGGEGNDTVRGGQENDSLSGGAGDDFVSGDRGDDVVSGGSGADTFYSFAEAGSDRILDFNQAQGDRVRLEAGSAYTLEQAGLDAVVRLEGGARVVLVGVLAANLIGTDWIGVG